MTTSQQGIDLIKKFEGCKLTAYKPVPTEKYYTIGYGHYGADVTKGMVITEECAEALLKEDVKTVEQALNNMHVNFQQRQFDALVSWCFNLGLGNFNSSTMKKYILAGKPDIDITDQLVKWYNSAGKPLLGLKRRRVEEANMFLGKTTYKLDNSNNIYR